MIKSVNVNVPVNVPEKNVSPYGSRVVDRCEQTRWQRKTPYARGVAAMEGGRALLQILRIAGARDHLARRWKADLKRFARRVKPS